MTLYELAGMCAAAEGSSRELDVRIFHALSPGLNVTWEQFSDGMDFAKNDWCPRYTSSIDAALTIIPNGWRWVMREASPDKANPNEKGFFARLETEDFECVTWGKGSDWLTDVTSGQDVNCWAASAPLAMCSVAVSARASVDRSPKGQDPEEGLEAKPASAVPEGETPNA